MSLIQRIITSLGKILRRRKPSSRKPARKKTKKVSARKKSPPKKGVKPRSKPRPKPVFKVNPVPAVKETEVAGITHFFPKISVCVFKMTKGEVKAGDKVRVKGNSTDFVQTVKSIQIESVDVKSARRGQLVGIKVDRPARPGDKVYRIG